VHFASKAAAQRFVVRKALDEASTSGAPLSAAEAYMLSWSESDPCFTRDTALDEAFDCETSGTAYETKMAALLRAAYERLAEV